MGSGNKEIKSEMKEEDKESKENQAQRQDYEKMIACEQKKDEAVRIADTAGIINILREDILYWAASLKRNMFQLFDEYKTGHKNIYQKGFKPLWLSRPFVGSKEAYEMLEFHKGVDYAKRFSERFDKFLKVRGEFVDYAISYNGSIEDSQFYEFQAGVDYKRKELKQIALSLADHLNLLRSQLLKPGGKENIKKIIPASSQEGYVILKALEDLAVEIINVEESSNSLWNIPANTPGRNEILDTYNIGEMICKYWLAQEKLENQLTNSRSWFFKLGEEDGGKGVRDSIMKIVKHLEELLRVYSELSNKDIPQDLLIGLLKRKNAYKKTFEHFFKAYTDMVQMFREMMTNNKWQDFKYKEPIKEEIKTVNSNSWTLHLADSISEFAMMAQDVKKRCRPFWWVGNKNKSIIECKKLTTPEEKSLFSLILSFHRIRFVLKDAQKWFWEKYSPDGWNEIERGVIYIAGELLMHCCYIDYKSPNDFEKSIKTVSKLAHSIREAALRGGKLHKYKDKHTSEISKEQESTSIKVHSVTKKTLLHRAFSNNFIKATIKHLPYFGPYMFDLIYGVDGVKTQKKENESNAISEKKRAKPKGKRESAETGHGNKDAKREPEGKIVARKPWYKKAWAIIIVIIVVLGGIWTVIQIYESETFKSVFHDSKREVQIPKEKLDRVRAVERAAKKLIDEKDMKYTHAGYVQAVLILLEEHKDIYPDAYARANTLYEANDGNKSKYKKDGLGELEHGFGMIELASQMDGILRGLIAVNTE